MQQSNEIRTARHNPQSIHLRRTPRPRTIAIFTRCVLPPPTVRCGASQREEGLAIGKESKGILPRRRMPRTNARTSAPPRWRTRQHTTPLQAPASLRHICAHQRRKADGSACRTHPGQVGSETTTDVRKLSRTRVRFHISPKSEYSPHAECMHHSEYACLPHDVRTRETSPLRKTPSASLPRRTPPRALRLTRYILPVHLRIIPAARIPPRSTCALVNTVHPPHSLASHSVHHPELGSDDILRTRALLRARTLALSSYAALVGGTPRRRHAVCNADLCSRDPIQSRRPPLRARTPSICARIFVYLRATALLHTNRCITQRIHPALASIHLLSSSFMPISQGWQLHQIPLVPRSRVPRTPPAHATRRRHYLQYSNLTSHPSARATTPTARTNRGSEACVASSFRFDYDTPAPRVDCDTYTCPRQLGRVMNDTSPRCTPTTGNTPPRVGCRSAVYIPAVRTVAPPASPNAQASRIAAPSPRSKTPAYTIPNVSCHLSPVAALRPHAPPRTSLRVRILATHDEQAGARQRILDPSTYALSLRECTPHRCTPPVRIVRGVSPPWTAYPRMVPICTRCRPHFCVRKPHESPARNHRTATAGTTSHLPTLHVSAHTPSLRCTPHTSWDALCAQAAHSCIAFCTRNSPCANSVHSSPRVNRTPRRVAAGLVHTSPRTYVVRIAPHSLASPRVFLLKTFQKSVEITPESHPDRAKHLHNLAVARGIRYQRLGDMSDLETAVMKFQEIVDVTLDGQHPDRAEYLYNLAVSFTNRYRRLGDLDDLEAALQRDQEALDLTPDGHPDRAHQLQSLGVSFEDRYQRLGDLDDLEAALQRKQEALDLTPDGHPDRARRLQSLAVSFTNRYQRLGDLADLEAALQRYQEALDLTPDGHPDRAHQLQSLAASFTDRYRRLGALDDLEAALQRKQDTLDLTPDGHPDRAHRLQSLAVSFTDRYRRLGALADLEAALQRYQEALDLTPDGHPDRAHRLQSLAVSFTDRYRRLGALDDLEAALQRKQEALDLTPDGHPDRAHRLQSLAVSFTDRYRRLGALDDLEAALQRKQAALDLTPDGHPDRARRLQSLGVSFTDRYRRLGDLDDLEAALQRDQDALDLTPDGHPDRAGRLQSLGMSFTHRYRRLGDLDDLEAALQRHQEALDLTPDGHPDRAHQLQSLGVSFEDRYQRLGDLDDLEAALQRYQEALDLTPDGHPDRAGRLHSLAVSFTDRYQRLGDLDDLEAALQRHQEALDLTPDGHPDRAGRLQSLAVSFTDRYQRLGDLDDLQSVHTHYIDSFQIPTSRPENSWNAALHWASVSEEFKSSNCITAYSNAFNLLPEILWIGNILSVRHAAIHRLNIGEVTSSAVKTCIIFFDLVSAVEIMEQGLGITFQQMLQLRTDLDELPPAQANRLKFLSSELYSGTSSDPRDLAIKRQDLLKKIRQQPGLEHFLLPKPYKELCYSAQRGPVVILNDHQDHCDGIIILDPTSDPKHSMYSWVIAMSEHEENPHQLDFLASVRELHPNHMKSVFQIY
ncbi:hypothetical protein C8R44DRAFT_894969 [Mycena epipterygia]|nr:hypothetical protein C8R44DRAFT_894969 [Mycena epipterygia]